jgi:iron(III) transport system substrate-binding protein
VSHKGVKASLPNLPANLESKLIKNNFAFAAKNRDRILEEWQKRYATKSEPK